MSTNISRIRVARQIPPSNRYRIERTAATTITLDATYDNKMIVCTATDPVTVNVPNSLRKSFNVLFRQKNEGGDITLVPYDEAKLDVEGDLRTTWGKGSMFTLVCEQNDDGVSAEYSAYGSFA